MASSFSVDTSGASEKIKAIRTKLSDGIGKVLEQELTNARAEIIARTQSGLDVDNKPFVKYSKYYAFKKFFKTEGVKGKRRKNKVKDSYRAYGGTKAAPAITPNLTLRGTMLRSLKVKVTKIAGGFLGKIYVNGAQADKVRGNQKLRKFFDLSKEQYDKIERKITEAINGRR